MESETLVPEEKIPTWVSNLIDKELKYFEFQQKNFKKGPKPFFQLKCIICDEKKNQSVAGSSKSVKSDNNSYITDKCISGFTRHLERHHPNEYQLFSKRNGAKQQQSIVPIIMGIASTSNYENNRIYYDKNDKAQRDFERTLLNYVVLESVSLRVCEGIGFCDMIRSLDKKVRIPSRRTLVRMLDTKYDQVIESLKTELRSLPVGTGHLMIDIWSSRQKMSVIGFKVQFVGSDWKIHNCVLGFKDFPETHSGENIRKTITEFLDNTFDLSPQHFFSLTSDNASNMLAAFKFDGADESVNEVTSSRMDLPESNEAEEDTCTDALAQQLESILPDDLDSENDLIDDPAILIAIENLLSPGLGLIRNPCLAHLAQLGIKDCLVKDLLIKALVKKVNSIVLFFHKSNYWLGKLKAKNGGLGLVKPCVTRWNSLYHCLKRIADPKRVEMIPSINSILKEAKAAAIGSKKEKVPSVLHETDIISMKIALALLEPFATLTDDLQSDGVTSSLVILGLINAIECAMDVEIDEECEHSEALKGFKVMLCESMKHRFTTETGQKTYDDNGKRQRIFTCDVFNNSTYILAALLDPRIKATPFDDRASSKSILQGKVPSMDDAMAYLQTEYDCCLNDVVCLDDASQGSRELVSPSSSSSPPPKRKKSMFNLVKKVLSQTPSQPKPKGNEIEMYFKMEILTEGEDPLAFWTRNEGRFPNLAWLAKKFLAVPATSGSIERLFSIAGDISRSRRARLTIKNMEKMLCYKQQLLNLRAN